MRPTKLLFFLLYVAFLAGIANHASAFYNPGTGRWINKDPAEESGGINLYAAMLNNPVNLIDPFGLMSLNLEFNAFIPGSLGTSIPGLPGTWSKEPGPLSAWSFATDNRGFGGGSSRLRSYANFDSDKIGRLEKAGKIFTTEAGLSERVRVIPNVGTSVTLWGVPYGVRYVTQTKLANSTDSVKVKDINACKSEVTVKASAAYPFIGIAPNIDYKVTFILERIEKDDTVYLSMKGSHNVFPFYEGLANRQNVYEGKSSSTGPNLWNLGIQWKNFDVPRQQLK